jgi:hypothetical protein
MKIFIKNNWFKLSLLLIIIVMVGGWFYWFQLRPSQMRKKCFEAVSSLKDLSFSQANTAIDICLKRYGLEK